MWAHQYGLAPGLGTNSIFASSSAPGCNSASGTARGSYDDTHSTCPATWQERTRMDARPTPNAGLDTSTHGRWHRSKRNLRDQDRRRTHPRPSWQCHCSLPSIEWVQLSRLSADSTYQRSTDNETSRRLITSIAAKFDWRVCTPLVVSRRSDDTLVIIDGQHRWMAVCMRSDIPQLPCCIFRYANIEEEARMFIVANRARKPISGVIRRWTTRWQSTGGSAS